MGSLTLTLVSLLNPDGSSIYATRDLAAIRYRTKTWDFSRNILCGRPEQILPFQTIVYGLKCLDILAGPVCPCFLWSS